MRITGGSLRGRTIEAPPGRAIRPSSDRLREALFNVLMHSNAQAIPPLAGASILDAFAGTGALGLEALSRGATHTVFMDRDLAWARHNVEALGQTNHARLTRADILRPPPAETPVDIAFLDPPYGEGLAVPALEALTKAGWIGPASLVVVESGTKEQLVWPAYLNPVQTRHYGSACVTFLLFGR
jgi:16S rRNA (guanine966-N2)-methyltransferase